MVRNQDGGSNTINESEQETKEEERKPKTKTVLYQLGKEEEVEKMKLNEK